ncbi:MAG: hypothetical protein DWQ47_00125 [Acidobacteria bacterium]|nr:MAG: hypothetical protein DWQ32_10585 [Acidobacteriota bacterium]REK03919.1 MAG: hypothetical protein DWQ38_00110 [Acidobacteriota bacterium]REK15081.1 MAG: hypothetical protein DWQ43_16275 [Acidobacteriota bacterium]REK46171.1 MAG: hypothetical protein DWQ47_00125 [Acidobacteriota bacterium]
MRRNISFLFFAVFLLLVPGAVAQVVSIPEPPEVSVPETSEKEKEKNEKAEKVKALALEALRETAREIETLRTPENRISLAADLVGIMWAHDRDEAKEMFQVLTNSFIQLFTTYSTQLNAVGYDGANDDYLPFFSGNDPKRRALQRMVQALTVRKNLANAAAAKDPLLALEFVNATATAVRGGVFAERVEASDLEIKTMIVERYGVKDGETARELGRRLLKDGFDESSLALLKLLHGSGSKEAEGFARDVFSAASRDVDGLKPNFSAHVSLLEYANSEPEDNGKPDNNPVVDKNTASSHAGSFARAVLREEDIDSDTANRYAAVVRPFSESQAERIVKKFEKVDRSISAKTLRLREQLEASEAEDAERRTAAAAAAGSGDEDGEDSELSIEGLGVGELSEQQALLKELSESGGEDITDEEKREIVSAARASADSAKMPMAKITILTATAVTLKKLGDEELAKELVSEAAGELASNPRHFIDFLSIWAFAGGVVEISPDIAFAKLEDAVYRINEVINSGITIAEFIDVDENIVQDGEVLVGAFAGGMTSGITGMLLGGDRTITGLAEADFRRTKAIADKFDRPEIRIMAKTLVIGVVLGEKDPDAAGGLDLITGF